MSFLNASLAMAHANGARPQQPAAARRGPTIIHVDGVPMRVWMPKMRPENVIDRAFPPIGFTNDLAPRERMIVDGPSGRIELVGASARKSKAPSARIAPPPASAPAAPGARIASPPGSAPSAPAATGPSGPFFKVAPGGSIPGYPDAYLNRAMDIWATRGMTVADVKAQRRADARVYGLDQMGGESNEAFKRRETELSNKGFAIRKRRQEVARNEQMQEENKRRAEIEYYEGPRLRREEARVRDNARESQEFFKAQARLFGYPQR